MIENRTYDEIAVGDRASIVRTARVDDFVLFAHASGNVNPLHLPRQDINHDHAEDKIIAPSMWVASLVSGVIGTKLPGPGTLYLGHELVFSDNRVHPGDTLTVTVEVTDKLSDGRIRLISQIARPDGSLVATGIELIQSPPEKISLPDIQIPDVQIETHTVFDRYIAAACTVPALDTAVVCPEDASSLEGAMKAREHGLLNPVFVGSAKRIGAMAASLGIDISAIELVDIDDDAAAAARAVEMVHEGRVRAVMKGHLHSDVLLSQVVKKSGGLRTNRRISHVFIMDMPGRNVPLLISDAAINIAPDLETKVDIVQNAIDVGRSLGLPQPRVGVLSAVETVNPAIPSTIDAAVLSKMAERGQIRGGIVDGPLAMDNAVDMQAAKTKGITSLVAGQAEVLIVPNLEAGNMLAKELTFLANANAAGIVVGARVPVILTSRADNALAKLASCAIARLYQYWQETGKSLV
ncbi:MAG: bifunctional enoyl-CoA hydratase/phosphate acetyltransferase [Hyphomicrobiaceae bacterium]|nr:bifunctional enoyl-CoA hydratase/phosphate acetyltransferase [Hyphomicrobiaceae bacterium]